MRSMRFSHETGERGASAGLREHSARAEQLRCGALE
jgi:hypothetical protein